MRRPLYPFLQLHRDQRGAVAMLTAAVIVAMAGVGAIAVDVGYAVTAQRALQASTDAAALAGARVIGSTTNPITAATSYSAVAGNLNARSNLTVTMASGYPALKCFTSTGVTCTGSPSANAIQVKQQATVPTFFGNVIGVRSLSISATATAGAKGGQSTPIDVMVVLDTTQSMSNTQDSSCKGYDAYVPASPYKIDCALAGVRALLKGFWPTIDQVGIMVFPGLQSGQASKDYSCGSSSPTVVAYNSSPVYQVLGLESTYRTSNTSSLTTTDPLVIAAHGGCSPGGIKIVGGEGTFYADAITSAKSTLMSTGRTNVQKAIILISDGDASASSSNMPTAEKNNQCHEAITAAQSATTSGFWVYSIAYGAASTGCSTDSPSITPCAALLAIASDSTKFFADSSSSCPSGVNSTSGLTNLFQNIGTSLTSARMLPDNTN
jgi:Flp pilus assembly protein TadG